MLLNGGVYDGKRILGRNTVRMMTSNQIGAIPYGPSRFGLGFQLVTDSSAGRMPARVGTYSWGGAFSTSYWVDPEEKMVLLFYRQLWGTSHGALADKFRALVYQALND
jgi:CubicO group peptidase (beta-lactamase class C family)